MRLAAHYGATQSEILRRFSSSELEELRVFDDLYGFPDIFFLAERLAIASYASMSSDRPRIRELVPYFAPPPRRQTTADHKAFFSAISKKRV